jgi:hypothetical protein
MQKIQVYPDFAIMRLSVLKFKFPVVHLCGLHIYHRSVCTEYGHCMGLAARGMADLK